MEKNEHFPKISRDRVISHQLFEDANASYLSLTFFKKMVMNCFCGMVDRRKAFSLISSRDHCQRSSPSRISDAPRAGFKPAQNLSSGLVE